MHYDQFDNREKGNVLVALENGVGNVILSHSRPLVEETHSEFMENAY